MGENIPERWNGICKGPAAGELVSFLGIEVRLEHRVRQLCQHEYLFLGTVTGHGVRFNKFSYVAKFFEGKECVFSSLNLWSSRVSAIECILNAVLAD